MKRVLCLVLAGIAIVAAMSTMSTGQSQTQSLGDYARAVKKTKPAAKSGSKTYDNDNLPNNSTLSVVGNAPPADAQPNTDKDQDKGQDQDKAKDQDKNKDQAKDASAKPSPEGTANPDEKTDAQKKAEKSGEIKPGQSPEERQKAFDAWKEKIGDQKGKVDLLSRELNVLQRERQIKQADFYASTARAVQNARGFDDEDNKYKQQIADKQKALDDAKAKLNDLQEQARKAGAPNSVAE